MRAAKIFFASFFLHKDHIIDVNFGYFIHKCVINSLVVHPKFDTGAAENCTLATPVIEYKIFKICYAELPNFLWFSRYLIIKIFCNIPSWFNCHKDRELLQYVTPLAQAHGTLEQCFSTFFHSRNLWNIFERLAWTRNWK